MTEAEVVATYESLAALTGDMLAAAQASDWDRLIELEKGCTALVRGLRQAGGNPSGDEAFRRRKAAIIRKVLADDAEIRNLTQPWLAKLQEMLAGAAREGKVARAYDTAAARR
jgi:flagellar protein FliT